MAEHGPEAEGGVVGGQADAVFGLGGLEEVQFDGDAGGGEGAGVFDSAVGSHDGVVGGVEDEGGRGLGGDL